MENMKRPIGLTIFATLNFVYATLMLSIFIEDIIEDIFEGADPADLFLVLMVWLVPAVLLLLSSAGFIKMKWGVGYIIGNVAGVILMPLGIFVYFALMFLAGLFEKPLPPLALPFILLIFFIYPLLLLLFLNLRYKKYFEFSRKK